LQLQLFVSLEEAGIFARASSRTESILLCRMVEKSSFGGFPMVGDVGSMPCDGRDEIGGEGLA
jgi:hypothetical protein